MPRTATMMNTTSCGMLRVCSAILEGEGRSEVVPRCGVDVLQLLRA
jgi:hypothetical protein